MKQMQIMILLVSVFFLVAGGPAAMAADKPAQAQAAPISDETLWLQAQVLQEKAGRLEAEYRLTVGELGKIKGEIQKRATEKKAKEGKK